MKGLELALGIILLLVSILIIVLVLLQESKETGLSGAIAGGSDTYFSRNKKRSKDARYAKITKILTVVFFVLAICATFAVTFFSKS